jgi:nitroreductase
MKFRELLSRCRSYRRFAESEKIETRVLKEMIEDVRLTPSAANLQPLKFALVNQRETNEKIFPLLKWAAYLKDWEGPEPGERPSAYIILLGNRKISPYIGWDYGIALQTLLLSATDKGYGGCAIASFNQGKIADMLNLPEDLEIGCVLALGKPAETVTIDPVRAGDIKYWRDKKGVHHVPKRSVEELIFQVID